MSLPCTYPHSDWLMYTIYRCDSEFLGQIIRGAVQNIENAHSNNAAGIKDALTLYAPTPRDCLHVIRIKLLALLDQDEVTRRKLCEYKSEVAREWRPVCPQKAARFYAELHDNLLPAWVKDETVTSSEFVDRVRMAYLIS